MAADAMARNYEAFTGPERFTLLVEALARKDEAEADRLEGTCPQRAYRCDDAEFRDRVRKASVVACLVCLNMREGMAQIRVANNFVKVSDAFGKWPLRAAQMALLWGRAYGHWEAGVVDGVYPPAPDELAKQLKENEYLKEQLGDLRHAAADATRWVAETVQYAVGEMHASDLLSQWEGFTRFCREHLSVEPMTLLRAFGLETKDPGQEVLASYPDAEPDEAKAAEFAHGWARGWVKRFGSRAD